MDLISYSQSNSGSGNGSGSYSRAIPPLSSVVGGFSPLHSPELFSFIWWGLYCIYTTVYFYQRGNVKFSHANGKSHPMITSQKKSIFFSFSFSFFSFFSFLLVQSWCNFILINSQLVTGLPPFYSHNTDEIYESILSEELTFPSHANGLSADIKNLIRGLLSKHPMNRLGI